MSKKTAFINCTILDGTKDMIPQENMTVLVEDKKIIDIKKSNDTLSGYDVIDLDGRYLLPGLINLHVHLPGSGKPSDKAQSPEKVQKLMKNPISRFVVRKMCANYAKTQLLSGTTTIRTVGGLGNIDSTIRNKINSGEILGPRMLVSDMAISVPGGHMAGVLAYEATSEEECKALIRKIAENKPDLIKLMVTGGVLDATVKGEPGVLRMPYEYVKACCDEAHRLGYPVAAHVESPEGVKVALKAGVDTIEHGAVMDEEILTLFKEKGASNICTISPGLPLAKLDPKLTGSTELTKFNGNIVLDGIISSAKAALENDIPVGLGTDSACPFITQYDMWREIYYFSKFVGVSNSFAIHTATLKNAEIIGLDKEIGSIEVGKYADMLIVDKNPIDDLKALRTPYMVVANGNVIKEPKIKKIAVIEESLDSQL